MQRQLCFKEVDMAFLIRDQFLADLIADAVAMVARLDMQGAGVMFNGQLAPGISFRF